MRNIWEGHGSELSWFWELSPKTLKNFFIDFLKIFQKTNFFFKKIFQNKIKKNSFQEFCPRKWIFYVSSELKVRMKKKSHRKFEKSSKKVLFILAHANSRDAHRETKNSFFLTNSSLQKIQVFLWWSDESKSESSRIKILQSFFSRDDNYFWEKEKRKRKVFSTKS